MHASSLRRIFKGVLATVPFGAALACYPFGGNCPSNPYSVTITPDAADVVDASVNYDVATDEPVPTRDGFVADPDATTTTVDAGDPCYQGCPYNGPDGGGLTTCVSQTDQDGGVTYKCNYDIRCLGGRRPRGYHADDIACANPVGQWFAQQADLEAASVRAFGELGDELRSRGAPVSFARAAGRAARDEVRHARSVGALAQAFGGRKSSAKAMRGKPARRAQSLAAFAIHNAVEGCVRETFAALVAEYQARAASNPAVRETMARVARDETRHAALAFRVGEWARGRLSTQERARVRAAQNRAVASLRAELSIEPPADLAGEAGLPPASVALAMLDGLQRALWS